MFTILITYKEGRVSREYQVLVFASLLAFANAGIYGEAPLALAGTPVVSAYSSSPLLTAPAISKSVVQTYTSHAAPVAVAAPVVAKAAPLVSAYSAPLALPAHGPVLSAYSSPLSYAAPAPVVSTYSSPVVSAYSSPVVSAYSSPVVSAYSAPVVAKSVANVAYPSHGPVVSAYSAPIVTKSLSPAPIAYAGHVAPVVSAYSAGHIAQPW
ncbi:unnamed protein product [Diabrotica balteata]|uniref:Cuticle protein 16.5-like n=1 Tax=Diabrotica balteata TaxID=107213 RepID=A0A9N9SWL0_DIABA|nr:unnamed protein product [Diabrotica balteata]